MIKPDMELLVSLKNQARNAQKTYEIELNAQASQVCPVKVGGTALVDGYAHRGKSILVDELKAELISMGLRTHRLVVTAHGHVLGTNGQPTKHRAKSVWGSTYKC